MTLPAFWMVFDVESVGLHGEGFAVGWVVVDEGGKEIEQGGHSTDPVNASGDKDAREWVAANVPAFTYDCDGPEDVRRLFWIAWRRWKEKGAALAADCCWPVEARFLIQCVRDDPDVRECAGPYPLHDVASVRLAAGFDPLATEERRPDELPAHDPLADARQSARLLIEALSALKESVPCSSA